MGNLLKEIEKGRSNEPYVKLQCSQVRLGTYVAECVSDVVFTKQGVSFVVRLKNGSEADLVLDNRSILRACRTCGGVMVIRTGNKWSSLVRSRLALGERKESGNDAWFDSESQDPKETNLILRLKSFPDAAIKRIQDENLLPCTLQWVPPEECPRLLAAAGILTELEYAIVEALAVDGKGYKGNPAAVVLLETDDQIPDEVKQKIASTMNSSKTVFIAKAWTGFEVPREDADDDDTTKVVTRTIRWFTPKNEVKLCDHGTIAGVRALKASLESATTPVLREITFLSRFCRTLKASVVSEDGDLIKLDFPSDPAYPYEADEVLKYLKALYGGSAGDRVEICGRGNVIGQGMIKKVWS